MQNKYTLAAQPRQILGRKVKQLRSQGVLPANVFSKQAESANVQVKTSEFKKTYALVGESTLVYLDVDGEKEPRPVLVRDVTIHPVSGDFLHVDFNQVSLKEKVTAPVSVNLVGEAPAEKEKLGILVQQLDEVEIEALPTDMPEHLDISVDGLAAVNDTILVKDIVVDAKVTIKTDPEAIVAKIEALAAEEPVEAPVAAEGETAAAEGETAETAATEAKAEESEKTE